MNACMHNRQNAMMIATLTLGFGHTYTGLWLVELKITNYQWNNTALYIDRISHVPPPVTLCTFLYVVGAISFEIDGLTLYHKIPTFGTQ